MLVLGGKHREEGKVARGNGGRGPPAIEEVRHARGRGDRARASLGLRTERETEREGNRGLWGLVIGGEHERWGRWVGVGFI